MAILSDVRCDNFPLVSCFVMLIIIFVIFYTFFTSSISDPSQCWLWWLWQIWSVLASWRLRKRDYDFHAFSCFLIRDDNICRRSSRHGWEKEEMVTLFICSIYDPCWEVSWPKITRKCVNRLNSLVKNAQIKTRWQKYRKWPNQGWGREEMVEEIPSSRAKKSNMLLLENLTLNKEMFSEHQYSVNLFPPPPLAREWRSWTLTFYMNDPFFSCVTIHDALTPILLFLAPITDTMIES